MSTSFPRVDLAQTVCAIATPPGRGGLGVIRLSGPQAIAIADRVFHGRRPLRNDPGFTVRHGYFLDPRTSEEIDEVIVTLFRAPKSFTGEDLIEFSAHGGDVVLRKIVAILTENGAFMAVPGEFTLRAFLNGRIDLTEAEAVADIIAAKTEKSARAALRQLKGALQHEITKLRVSLVDTLAHLEAGIDFTEEDLDSKQVGSLHDRLDSLADRLRELLSGYRKGRILRDGFVVVLAGPPNVGKSTLFNRLAQDERAIVTDIPGTTRDILREYINLNGYPVCLVDTAGIRDATGRIEQIGVGRAHDAVNAADGIIWITDTTREPDRTPMETLPQSNAPLIICLNKTDLVVDTSAAVESIRQKTKADVLPISAKTGDGIERLWNRIGRWLSSLEVDDRESAPAINDRHRKALNEALNAVEKATQSLCVQGDIALAAFDVHAAADALGEIIGVTTTDDILGAIFSRFCVGK